MHGANRLGGNSLSDLLVFGAADRARLPPPRGRDEPGRRRTSTRSRSEAAAAELAAPLEPGRPARTRTALHAELQAMMQTLVGIFRTEADLDEAIAELADAAARWPTSGSRGGRAYNPGWDLVFELRNMLIVSEAIARSARQRTESRGAHSRLDYPATDDATWGELNSVVRRAGEAR